MPNITVSVDYILDEREQQALEELLPFWKQYKDENGQAVFKDWTVEKLFNSIMAIGCKHDISRKIKNMQFRQGMITADEMIDGEPFRLLKEAPHAEGQAVTN